MGLPSPPADEHHSRKGGASSTSSAISKPSKISRSGSQRKHKRASGTASPHPHDHSHGSVDGRHKRVWKACERCRMKKTKCDGEVPCKRCQDDGQICITKVRKKLEYKQLPRGYAEVLENTQFTLIATIHKLYAMLREGQEWEMDEPEMNERGQPVIHDIAQKLGCIRPNSDIDLPVHSVFPEDENDLRELARQLEEQQAEHEAQKEHTHNKNMGTPKTDRDSSSELDLSDLDNFQDYRKMAFGGDNDSAPNMSPAGSYCGPDFTTLSQSRINSLNTNSFPSPISPSVPDFSFMNSQNSNSFMQPSAQVYQNNSSNNLPLNLDMNQGLALQTYSFDNMFKTDNMCGDLSAEAMMGLSDPMMCGFEDDNNNAMRF